VPIEQIGTHSGERGQFYLVNISLPVDVAGKQLDSAIIVFAVDSRASSKDDEEVSPTIGVYPLTKRYVVTPSAVAGGRFEAPAFDAAVQSAHPITRGLNRVVKMDVTDIVRDWMANPSSNHGLVIGGLTGPNVGVVSLRNELPDSDGAVRLTFLYSEAPSERR
jgi:hypothetical protein